LVTFTSARTGASRGAPVSEAWAADGASAAPIVRAEATSRLGSADFAPGRGVGTGALERGGEERRLHHLRHARGALEAEVEQPRHLAVARGRAAPAEHRDQHAAAAALGGGDEVEAGGAGVAGLDAVGAGIAGEQLVGRPDRLAEGARRAAAEQVVVFRIVVEHVPPQHRHVARGGEMALRGQPRGVLEGGAAHAHGAGAAGHQIGEGRLAARHRLGEDHGAVIGRAHRGGADEIPDPHALAGAKADLGGRLPRRVARHRDPLVEVEPPLLHRLDHEVERHHLGQRGRMEARVGVTGVEHLAVARIHDHRRIFPRRRLSGRRRQGHRRRHCDDQPDSHQDSVHCVTCSDRLKAADVPPLTLSD
jgi:hypothetical protein